MSITDKLALACADVDRQLATRVDELEKARTLVNETRLYVLEHIKPTRKLRLALDRLKDEQVFDLVKDCRNEKALHVLSLINPYTFQADLWKWLTGLASKYSKVECYANCIMAYRKHERTTLPPIIVVLLDFADNYCENGLSPYKYYPSDMLIALNRVQSRLKPHQSNANDISARLSSLLDSIVCVKIIGMGSYSRSGAGVDMVQILGEEPYTNLLNEYADAIPEKDSIYTQQLTTARSRLSAFFADHLLSSLSPGTLSANYIKNFQDVHTSKTGKVEVATSWWEWAWTSKKAKVVNETKPQELLRIYDRDKLLNKPVYYNIVVIGSKGSGKTTWLRNIWYALNTFQRKENHWSDISTNAMGNVVLNAALKLESSSSTAWGTDKVNKDPDSRENWFATVNTVGTTEFHIQAMDIPGAWLREVKADDSVELKEKTIKNNNAAKRACQSADCIVVALPLKDSSDVLASNVIKYLSDADYPSYLWPDLVVLLTNADEVLSKKSEVKYTNIDEKCDIVASNEHFSVLKFDALAGNLMVPVNDVDITVHAKRMSPLLTDSREWYGIKTQHPYVKFLMEHADIYKTLEKLNERTGLNDSTLLRDFNVTLAVTGAMESVKDTEYARIYVRNTLASLLQRALTTRDKAIQRRYYWLNEDAMS